MQSFLIIAAMALTGAGVGYLVLQPMTGAKGGTRKIERFYIVDLLSLVLILQVPLVFLSVVSRMRDSWDVGVAGSVLVAVVVGIWWRSASLLSSLGILGPARRILFCAVVVPLAILCSMALVPTAAVLLSQASVESATQTTDVVFPFAFAGLVLLPATIYMLRQLTHWVLKERDVSRARGIAWISDPPTRATGEGE